MQHAIIATLLCPYYRPANPDRASEIEFTMLRNIESFDRVMFISDCSPVSERFPDGSRNTAIWTNIERRQKFKDLILINSTNEVPGDSLVFIANADIMIPRGTIDQIDHWLQPGECYCLSRWDFSARFGIKHFNASDSQDTWVMRMSDWQLVPPTVGDYLMGNPGCDNRFAHELVGVGFRILNPSLDVKTYHIHLTNYRTTNLAANRVPGPYLFIAPHRLGQETEYAVPAIISKSPSRFQR